METSVVYGLIAVVVAAIAAIVGIGAAHLNRNIPTVTAPTDYLRVGSRQIEECRQMWSGARVAALAGVKAGEYSAASFVIAAAVLVFCATRTSCDPLLRWFLFSAGALALVGSSIKLFAATNLVSARDCFDAWYRRWPEAEYTVTERPSKERVRDAFRAANTNAATRLAKHRVWPYD
jgi:hypothetical protein